MKKFWKALIAIAVAGLVGIYVGAAINLEGYLGVVLAIAVMGAFIVDAIEKK